MEMSFSVLATCILELLAGLGLFLYGMETMSDGLERVAGKQLKSLLGAVTKNRATQVVLGFIITVLMQSSSATTVMLVGFVNAGIMQLSQAVGIIMGANIGTTVTGLLVALKNDYFNMAMYALAFIGVMMSFAKKEKYKLIGGLCAGLGLIFVGLNIMGSDQAFGSDQIKAILANVFQSIDFPLLLILVGAVFTALIQSSSASTGIVITMVGTGVMELDLALFIILGANIGTCVTAMLASMSAQANAKRVSIIHLTFNVIGSVLFAAFIWIFKEPIINLLMAVFPNDDTMSVQMRVSLFHVLFNVTTTVILLPFTKQLVKFSQWVIKDKKDDQEHLTLCFVDDLLLNTPPVALMQVKKEMDYMIGLVEENIRLCFVSVDSGDMTYAEQIRKNEEIIDFTNGALTKFLIKLSANVEVSDEKVIGSYFHVLNDLERIGDHAENFHEIGVEMAAKKISFSETAKEGIGNMRLVMNQMFDISKDAFENLHREHLPQLTELEESMDELKKDLIASHFARLAEGNCSMEVSPYYSSTILGLERVADHLVNVGYSIVNPTGSQTDKG